jgi:hypothetical protein
MEIGEIAEIRNLINNTRLASELSNESWNLVQLTPEFKNHQLLRIESDKLIQQSRKVFHALTNEQKIELGFSISQINQPQFLDSDNLLMTDKKGDIFIGNQEEIFQKFCTEVFK